jgi:hypothetical protein
VPNGTHRVGKEGARGLHGQQDVPESQAPLQTAMPNGKRKTQQKAVDKVFEPNQNPASLSATQTQRRQVL